MIKTIRCILLCLMAAMVQHAGLANAAALSKKEVVMLTAADALGLQHVTISALAKRGQGDQAIRDIQDTLGGRLVYTHKPVDFFIAVIPIDQISSFLENEHIAASSFDVNFNLNTFSEVRNFSLAEKTLPSIEEKIASINAGHTSQPYPLHLASALILNDLNADKWAQEHPDADGRGVVIGHIEGVPDVLHPVFQTARLADGTETRKLLDVHITPKAYYGLDQASDIWEWNFVFISPPSHPNEAVEGKLHVPNPILTGADPDLADKDSDAYVAYWRGSGNANQPGKVKATAFKFSWHADSQTLLFDTDRDGDLRDETPVHPFGKNGDVITLGVDDPKTEARESVGLVFQVQDKGRRLAFDFGSGAHPTMVAATAAGSKGKKGLIDGVAPGAQLIPYTVSPNVAELSRGTIKAFSDPRTDLILYEASGPGTATDSVNEGLELHALLLKRLVDLYDKPVLITAANTPGMSQIVDLCGAENIICVGAADTQTSMQVIEGVDIGVPFSLHTAGSSGPTTHGRIAPDIVAPARTISLYTTKHGSGARSGGLYRSPWGYRTGSGTSNAAPVAAGAVALLVSAAKQQNLPYDAASIHRALRASARFVDEGTIKAYQQGRGVLDVAAAWKALQALAKAPAVDIEVKAPVRTVHSHRLSTPHQGVGLFEREGWSVGDRGTRTLTLTRTSGSADPMTFTLHVRGDADTFTVPASVTLPLNQPVAVDVQIKTKTAGAHSGLLVLGRPGQAHTDAEIGLTIIVPTPLTAESGYRHTLNKTMRPLERQMVFLKADRGTDGLWMRAHYLPDQYGGVKTPISGTIHSPGNKLSGYYGSFASLSHQENPNRGMTIPFAAAGVWEFLLGYDDSGSTYDLVRAAAGTPEAWQRSVEAEFALMDVSLQPGRDRVRMANRGAAFYGGLASTPRASLREVQGMLGPRKHLTYDIEVEPGAEMLAAEIAATGKSQIDADLTLYYCPDPADCKLVRQSRSFGMSERAVVERPATGLWKVVVSTFAASEGEAGFIYRDYWTHPQFGMVSSTDPHTERKVGSEWTAGYSVLKGRAAPTDGRRLANVFYIHAPRFKSTHAQTPQDEPAPTYAFGQRYHLVDTHVPLGLVVR